MQASLMCPLDNWELLVMLFWEGVVVSLRVSQGCGLWHGMEYLRHTKTLHGATISTGCSGGQSDCLPSIIACQIRTRYVYWDQFHPTEAMNVIYARRAYIIQTPSDVHPVDIHAHLY
ncbi:hypothetical protein AAG906_028739 [Vitis piasezkii]